MGFSFFKKKSDEEKVMMEVDKAKATDLPFRFESLEDCKTKKVAEQLVKSGKVVFTRAILGDTIKLVYPDKRIGGDIISEYIKVYLDNDLIVQTSKVRWVDGKQEAGKYRLLRECERGEDFVEKEEVKEELIAAENSTECVEPEKGLGEILRERKPPEKEPVMSVTARVVENASIKPKAVDEESKLACIGGRILTRRRELEEELKKCDGEICRIKAYMQVLEDKIRFFDEIIGE